MFSIENKTVLIVIAHPDDEIIFGWPILQNRNINKKLLCCSSDFNNPERSWCKNRKLVLNEVCKEADVNRFKCLDYNSEFYRMPTRNEELKKMTQDVVSNIKDMEPFDYIYTHNFWGEYGHMDHVLINNVCMSLKNKMIVSDMFIQSNWLCYSSRPEWFNDLGKIQNTCANLDKQFYWKLESMYRNSNVWTWSKPPIESCSMFIL